MVLGRHRCNLPVPAMTCQEHADKFCEIIEAGLSGHGDEADLRLIASHAATLRCCLGLDDPAYQQVAAVYKWADTYFSPTKRRPWRGRLPQVKLRLRQELSGLQASLSPGKPIRT